MRRAAILLLAAVSCHAGGAEKKTFLVTMRDGVRLATDVYGAEGEARKPALLMRTPYNKNGTAAVAEMFVGAGYIVVVQDCRGRYGSEGAYEPYRHDGEDGSDTLQWIRRQRWCNSRIGMWGASHPGAVEWQAAARDGGLAALVPVATFTSLYKACYRGGALRLAFVAGAGVSINPPPSGQAPPDDAGEHLLYLPVSELDQRLGWPLPWLAGVLRHPTPDSYWQPYDSAAALDRLAIPALHLDGYYDLFCRDVVESFQRLSANSKNRGNQRLILGPWDHTSLGKSRVGALDFGPGAVLNFSELYLKWFDEWVRQTPAAAQPAVRYFSIGDNTWQSADAWPPQDFKETALYLSSAGRANRRRGDGKLERAAPAHDEAADSFRSDPADPVPVNPPGAPKASRAALWRPADQSAIEDRADVLVYTSEALSKPIRFAGPLAADLWVRTDTPDADWAVKLVDVGADGFALGLAEGVTRLSYRDSESAPSAAEPGRLYRIRVDLGHAAARIASSHRLRVEIAGSCFPLYDRNSHTQQGLTSRIAVPATQQILHSARTPSRILLFLKTNEP
jgi:putative CocE/NonD family hydrolase